jgi:hypothetical protein
MSVKHSPKTNVSVRHTPREIIVDGRASQRTSNIVLHSPRASINQTPNRVTDHSPVASQISRNTKGPV